MKKILANCLWLCAATFTANCQNAYSLSAVPESIKNKANVIIHLEDIKLEIESIDKASLNIHKIFTVVNEDGKDALLFAESSSKFISLDDAEIKVFDANGKQIARYRKKDMMKIGIGEGLIEDGFMTYYPVSTSAYPVTLDIKYEQKLKNTINIPAFRFINVKEGVVESNFTATVPAEITLRYKAENTSIEPAITENGGSKTYKWNVKNLPPLEYEEGAVSGRSRYPHIKLVANQFSAYGLKGDLSSWKNFGGWIKDLYSGLDELPAARQQFFSQLVKDAPNEREKIRLVYRYLQQNFRYVSIQLGIGGFRPFSAEFTDNKKYGDCKALSNYMKAALKSVGIKSYVAIVNAEFNELPVDPRFPINDFNHVILCVPGDKDSTWLECTSSTVEFGELGTFTENRNALLITDDGGVLVPTPKSHSSENTMSTRTTVTVVDDLTGSTETTFTTKGEFRENMNYILKDKKDDQKKAVVLYFGFRQPDIFELLRDSADDHKARLRMLMAKVPEFVAGDKWFISPRINKIWSSKLPKAENRSLDFYFRFPFERHDTTIIKLPAAAKPDALPEEKILDCNYASYKSKYWYNEKEQSVYSATSLILKQHRIPSSEYESVKKFFDDLMQDDSQKIVVKKPETEKKAF